MQSLPVLRWESEVDSHFCLKYSFSNLGEMLYSRRERVCLILLTTTDALDGTAFLYNKAIEVATLSVRLGADE